MVDLDLVSKTDHIPVLIEPIIENISPVTGVWVDATFGAGGYTRALLDAGAEFVFAIDRDPNVFSLAEKWLGQYPGRIELINDVFSSLEKYVDDVESETAKDNIDDPEAKKLFDFGCNTPSSDAKPGVTSSVKPLLTIVFVFFGSSN